MAAGPTYTPIATTTLGSAGTITFSSIPSTYTDLRLVIIGTTASGTNLDLRFNSDTSTNYSYTQFSGSGSVTGGGIGSNITFARLDYYGYFDTVIGNHIVDFMNYSNTTTYKTVLSRANNTNNGLAAVVALWRSTAAINSITTVTTLAIGTTATLYGIAAA